MADDDEGLTEDELVEKYLHMIPWAPDGHHPKADKKTTKPVIQPKPRMTGIDVTHISGETTTTTPPLTQEEEKCALVRNAIKDRKVKHIEGKPWFKKLLARCKEMEEQPPEDWEDMDDHEKCDWLHHRKEMG